MSPDAQVSNASLSSTLEEAAAKYKSKNLRSWEQHKEASKSLPGGNTRTVLFAKPFPLTLVKGEGCYVETLDGQRCIDFLGEYTAGLFGHSQTVIVDAVKSALDRGIVLGGHTRAEQQLAQLLCERFPSLERVRFTNSGTEANLMAMSLARAVTGREKILVFDGAYHGGVFVFAGSGNPINAPFDFVIGQYNDIEATRSVIDRHAGEIAAIVVEPMMGAAGCIPAQEEFLRDLRLAASRIGALLVFDEVMTSRLSPGGLQEAFGIDPDLTTLGKYIGGGLSFGAFGGAERFMERFNPHNPDAFPHAGTFNNNILTMSAGLAGMTQVLTPETLRALNARGEHLRARLNEVARSADVSLQFTGRGSMMTAHFRRGPIRSPSDLDGSDNDLRELFFLDLVDAGIWIARRGMINLSLPIGDRECDQLCAAVKEFVSTRKSLLRAA